jgi:hypothetical protein
MAQSFLAIEQHRELLLCTVNVIKRYIAAGHPLVISFPDGWWPWDKTDTLDETRNFLSDLLDELHALELWPIYILCERPTRNLEDIYTARKYKSYIVIAQNIQSEINVLMNFISIQVQHLQEIEAGNPKGVYLVVLLDAGDVNEDVIKVLSVLWEWKVLDVIVITKPVCRQSVANVKTQVDLFSWFPFQSPSNCTHVTDIVLMDQWDNGTFVKNADLFPNKITRNLNQCPLVASTIKWGNLVIASIESNSDSTEPNVVYKDGLEVILYNTIVETFNMTTAFIKPIPAYGNIWGDYSPVNNTYTGVIGDSKFGRSNVSFCGLPKNYFFEMHIDSTHSYLESGFNWYVQCARPRPRWQVLVRMFTLSVWAFLILTFFAVAIVMWRLAKFPDEHQETAQYRSFVGTFQMLLAVFLNVGVNRMPLTLVLRVFFCVWVWSSFALTTVFQTYFTSFLVDPGLEKQVSDVEELLASNLVLTFDNGYLHLFDDVEESEQQILSRWVSCPGFEACSRRTAVVGDAATILDFQKFDLYSQKFVDENGNSLLCRLPSKISGYLITMFMQKGNPLFRHVNDVILRIMEAGLVNLWWSQMVERLKSSTYQESEDTLITYFVFSMSHLYMAFTFLVLSHGLSVLVFILELLCNFAHITKPRNHPLAELIPC